MNQGSLPVVVLFLLAGVGAAGFGSCPSSALPPNFAMTLAT